MRFPKSFLNDLVINSSGENDMHDIARDDLESKCDSWFEKSSSLEYDKVGCRRGTGGHFHALISPRQRRQREEKSLIIANNKIIMSFLISAPSYTFVLVIRKFITCTHTHFLIVLRLFFNSSSYNWQINRFVLDSV